MWIVCVEYLIVRLIFADIEKNIKIAVLKAKSPSCGKNHIYDGTFSHQLVEGDGIFVQMLKEKGIAVYSENEVTEVLKLINGGK